MTIYYYGAICMKVCVAPLKRLLLSYLSIINHFVHDLIDANYVNVIKRVRQSKLMIHYIDLLLPCKNLIKRLHIYIILIDSLK